MDGLQHSDEALWMTRMAEEFGDPLVQFAHAYLGDWDTAQDAAQETVLRLIIWHRQHPHATIRPGWLFTVCRNVVRDAARRERLRSSPAPAHEPVSDGPDVSWRLTPRGSPAVAGPGVHLALSLCGLHHSGHRTHDRGEPDRDPDAVVASPSPTRTGMG